MILTKGKRSGNIQDYMMDKEEFLPNIHLPQYTGAENETTLKKGLCEEVTITKMNN